MSNIPPGVTGNDPHLVGALEREVQDEVECLGTVMAAGGDGHEHDLCGWQGVVTVTEYVLYSTFDQVIGTRVWSCPACQTVWEENDVVLAERDPDEGRD